MDENKIVQEINDLFNILKRKENIYLSKINTEPYCKGIIIYINRFINNYINLNPIEKKNAYRYINYLRINISKYYYKMKNDKCINKIILLFYLTIFHFQISTTKNVNINSSKKYIIFRKLNNLLKFLSLILSYLYSGKIIDINELASILKLLILLSMNDEYRNIKENSDIKNFMYYKECLNIIFIIFNDKSNGIEQRILIDIFKFINNNICFRDKSGINFNYTNKFYLLNNDHKTTRLLKYLNTVYIINNKDLTKIYFGFLSNIYYFNFNYNNLIWPFYELLQPLLENIKEKTYETILKEISFPEFKFNFVKEIISKEREFINNNNFILKNAFYFSGKQPNSGIIAEIGKIKDRFLLAFGFNLIITDEIKDEYIIFQIKNYEEKVQLKASIFKKNNDFILYIIDSSLNISDKTWKMTINPYYYYSFLLSVQKGKYITIYYYKNDEFSEEQFKVKEIKTTNLLVCVGCEIEKIDKNSNLIHKNYKYMNRFTGFIGDIFSINMHSYKEKYFLEKNILNLKGKYGFTIIKSLIGQKSLEEYIISNLDRTYKNEVDTEDEQSIFKRKVNSKKNFKIIDNIGFYVNSSNFSLIDYSDNIDYMNYDNNYHQKEKLLKQSKKENQYFINFKTKEFVPNDKIIEISSSLFNCHFNIIENKSSILQLIREDGVFYFLLIFEYYYQVLFKICKDVFTKNNNNIILTHEQNEIIKAIEKGIESFINFFWSKIQMNSYIKPYKITLFYYQINVVIKQFILLRNINDNIYKLLIKFMDKYQFFLNEFIVTNYKDDIIFYKDQRNFFFDFLLNPGLYKQSDKFNLILNLNMFFDSAFKLIQENILNDEILTENILNKILFFLIIINKECEERRINNNLDEKAETWKKTEKKYLFLLINYFNYIYFESNNNSNIIKILCDKLIDYKKYPNVFYNLSLSLFNSKLVTELEKLESDFIEKIINIFEKNYDKSSDDNIIYSISSVLILSSYYLIYNQKDEEKIKHFKTWYLQLSQKMAFIYFERIYNLIIGGVFEIKELIDLCNNFKNDLNENNINYETIFTKKEEDENNIITSIHKNIYYTLKSLSGFETHKRKSKTNIINDSINIKDINKIYKNNIEEVKKLIKKEKSKNINCKINITSNKEINYLEIEKIKFNMNYDTYFSSYYCFLDDIKKRCLMYNPKNILIKRFFAHIFYKSFFNCKAFMLIKNIYLNSFPKANVENKQLNYPSKIKNFSNIYGPKIFLKKNFDFYNTKYFPITHDFLVKDPPDFDEINNDKKAKIKDLIKANVSDINFYEHRFNINDILEEEDRYFDCELITQQYTYYGFIIIGNSYIYYGTKNDEPIDLRDKRREEIDLNIITKYSFSNRDKGHKGTKKKSIILFYHNINTIIKRRSFLMYQSMEIFCFNGKSYFFNFYRKEHCENAFKILNVIRENLKKEDIFDLINENTSEEVKKINSEVKNGIISNFTYLLKLNYYATRTYNDPNQYPVFPWLFFDLNKIEALLANEKSNINQVEKIKDLSNNNPEQELENNEIDKIDYINLKSNEDLFKKYELRNFNYPISLQSEEKREDHLEKKLDLHGAHYSTAAFIYFYLVRIYPFMETMVQLQNVDKENPNRLIKTMINLLKLLKVNFENREACPEFFSNFDFFSNLNCAFLGFQSNLDIVDDFTTDNNEITGNLFSFYFKYIYTFRKLLNSYLVSKYLPNWIDFIFGTKQFEKNENSFYNFNRYSYEEKLNLDDKLDEYIKRYQNNEGLSNKELRDKINLKIDFLNNFGITPHKILNNRVKLKTTSKIKISHDEIVEINKNIYFIKNNESILILFKNKKGNDKTKKIILWNYNNNKKANELEKNAFTCGYIKQLSKIKIDNSLNKIPIFKPCYSMCKFIMFNKLFILTCRYLGNIFKIQNNDYYIDVLCEDFVTCITSRNAFEYNTGDMIVYTGLKNGKVIEWYIKHSLDDYGKINIKELNSFHCHKGEITCFEIYENQNILITGGEDKMLFIRKTYDFELLTAINLVYCYMNPIINQKINIIPTLIKVSDLNCIYVLLYNYDTGKSFIRGYNVNGLFFKQSEENYYMNICFTKNCNLLVSYYDKKEIDIINCYDLQNTNCSISLNNFMNNFDKKSNKKKMEKEKEDDDILIWYDYDSNNHELILLYPNKIVKGNIKDKEMQINLEYY